MGACQATPAVPWWEERSPSWVTNGIDASQCSVPVITARPLYIVYSGDRCAERYNAHRSALALQHYSRRAQYDSMSLFHAHGLCRFSFFPLSDRLLAGQVPASEAAAAFVLIQSDFERLLLWLQGVLAGAGREGAPSTPLSGTFFALFLLQGGSRQDCALFSDIVQELGGTVMAVDTSNLTLWTSTVTDFLRDHLSRQLLSPLHSAAAQRG